MAFFGGGSGNRKRKGKELENTGIIVQRRDNWFFQQSIEELYRKEISKRIGRFSINNAIPLNAIKSDEFQKMCEIIALYGYKPHYGDGIRGNVLKQEVALIKESIEVHKAQWKRSGCSILMDSWNNGRGMSICNFFVNSPRGTVFLKSVDASDICKSADSIFRMIDEVVNEVGHENVVQVVTKNEENYRAAGRMLMENRKRIFCTPCAVHCIDLILEEFEKKLEVHKESITNGRRITSYIYSWGFLINLLHVFTEGEDLIRPAVTKCATSYLTLDCLNRNKEALMSMFTSREWKTSWLSKTSSGKDVENLVIDSKFWKDTLVCLKGANPLIHVLRLVYLDEKQAMGFIYKEMNQAKNKIRSAFNCVKESYMPLWDIIDEKWGKQFPRHLKAAAYYLNPQFHYSPDFKDDIEVKCGLYLCLQRMVPNKDVASKIDLQLEDFKHARNFFGSEVAKYGLTIKTKKPADWWHSCGFKHPELRNFAMRILSLTCSTSGCESNWNAFETVHTKRRNRLKQQTVNDVVFAMSNSNLVYWEGDGKAFEYSIDDIASDDEWIAGSDGSSSNNEELEFDDDIRGDEAGSSDDLESPYDDDEFNILLDITDEDDASIAMDGEGDMEDEGNEDFDVHALL